MKKISFLSFVIIAFILMLGFVRAMASGNESTNPVSIDDASLAQLIKQAEATDHRTASVQLTAEQKLKLPTGFKTTDTDGNGIISVAELKAVIKNYQLNKEKINAAEVYGLIDYYFDQSAQLNIK
ncbi:MAG: hypothetical protein RIQ89_137 [Bacteroidota bacterium]|jgi:Ca2+-binding EF-hand superfamily protein